MKNARGKAFRQHLEYVMEEENEVGDDSPVRKKAANLMTVG